LGKEDGVGKGLVDVGVVGIGEEVLLRGLAALRAYDGDEFLQHVGTQHAGILSLLFMTGWADVALRFCRWILFAGE
jgi:hypothetical protein